MILGIEYTVSIVYWQYIDIMSTVNRLYIDSMSTLYRLFLGTEVFGNIHGPEILIYVLTPGPPMAIFLSCGHPSAVLPRAAMGCQGLPRAVLPRAVLPRAAKGCQGLPRAAKGCQGGAAKGVLPRWALPMGAPPRGRWELKAEEGQYGLGDSRIELPFTGPVLAPAIEGICRTSSFCSGLPLSVDTCS